MRSRFSQSYKIHAVEKVFRRPEGISILEVARDLGIGNSTLHKWVAIAKNKGIETMSDNEPLEVNKMSKEKRPQQWRAEEKLEMIINCGALDEEAISALCRKNGIYPHHLKQWKKEFLDKSKPKVDHSNTSAPETKELKNEVKALRKELNRKDKALAETAALLVLQKKVREIWGNEEDAQ